VETKVELTLDCADARAQADFWKVALGCAEAGWAEGASRSTTPTRRSHRCACSRSRAEDGEEPAACGEL